MKVGMVSLGCPKNTTDSEYMLGILEAEGHRLVAEPQEADVIIINTCAFIDQAKQESIDAILEMAEYKNGNLKKLIVTGCLAERYHEEIKESLPEVDAIVGTGDFEDIAKIIDRSMSEELPCVFGHIDRTPEEGLPRVLSTQPHSAYVKIADGCDNNCTYCVIPKIRGRYRSRKMEDILSEVQTLAENGVREIIIIAQDTTRYGTDLGDGTNLAGLISELDKVDGIEWIRLHYFYPEAVSRELLEAMAASSKVCRYIDMPIQHINSEILRRMARRTNKEEIKNKISLIRKLMPDAVIRTSLIVGFPGESEEQFEELCEFLKEARLDRVGVFAYSCEEGTAAAGFDGQIDEEVKEERRDRLMSLQRDISYSINTEKIGSRITVLCEGYDDENYMYYGRSTADSIDVDSLVYFASEDETTIGEFVQVEILNADEYDLTGKRID